MSTAELSSGMCSSSTYTLDSDLAKAFLDHLQGDNIPANGVAPFDPREKAPLRWGEVVPLWFFRDLTSAGIKVVIFSSPISSMTDQSPLPHVSKLGRSIARFLNGLEQRVLYIASGDLAHTHETDCTQNQTHCLLYTSPSPRDS